LFHLGQKLTPYTVSLCERCGFVFQNPRWTKERIADYYREDYDTIHRPRSARAQKTSFIIPLTARQVFRRSRNYLPVSKKRIMDYGAGNGTILSCFRSILRLPDTEFLTIEPSVSRRCELNDAGFNVIGSSIADVPQTELGTVDFIIMRHVVEHFYDPAKELDSILPLLHPGGRLYIAVPNILYGSILNCLTFPHLSYFNEFTFRLLMKKLSLTVLKLQISGDEMYGIFEKTGITNISEIDYGSNLADTLLHIKKTFSAKTYILRRIRRFASYLIPRKFLLKMAKRTHRPV